MEYLTVEDLRAEFGDDVATMSDAQLLRRLDRLSSQLEDALGHSFGRALQVISSGADTAAVSATALTIGGDAYDFATYPTLSSLVSAINSAGDTYSAELLPRVNAQTPSTLLKAQPAVACGPTYDHRSILCVTALYLQLSGDRSAYLFLPLPLDSASAVTENGLALATTDYWAVPGEPWLIRKRCGCMATSCNHPKGRWPASYPGNITVTYAPQCWISIPGTIKQALMLAFASDAGLAPLESESFGEYSYRRGTARVDQAADILGGSMTRRYATRYHP